MIETEVRLFIPAHHFDAAANRFDAMGAVLETNRTTYYDTAAHDLWQAGFECRIRQNERGAKQTIKSRVGANAFSRIEIEAVLKLPVLDAAHLKAALPKPLWKSVVSESLTDVFTTEVTRRRLEIESGEGVVEAALDDGRIQSDDRCNAFQEVEFELVRGSFGDLVAAVEEFIAEVPCGLQLAGKAERGYELAGNVTPSHTLADRPRVPRAEKLPIAIATVFSNALHHVMANQPGVVAGDVEAIHQMRVGLRRLRSAVSSFRPVLDLAAAKASLEDATELFAMLGHIRDDDVFLDATLPMIPEAAFADGQREVLIKAVQKHRAATHESIRENLTAPSFVRWILSLQNWVDSGEWMLETRPLDRLLINRPVGDFAANRARRLEKRLVRAGQKAMKGSADDWHDVRKRLKKVRYSNEYLIDAAEHDQHRRKAARRSIRQLQNALGRFNDIAMVPAIVERVLRESRSSNSVVAAAHRSIGWAAAMVAFRIQELEETWVVFREQR